MKQGSIRTAVSLLFIYSALGCSSSPGSNIDYNGDYYGHLSGSPEADITLTISGGTISGTGEMEATLFWHGIGDPPHFTFTGTRSGKEVTISIPLQFEYNSAPYGQEPVWVEASTTLTLTGNFNDYGALIGNFGGPNPIYPDNPFTGTWSVVKSTSASISITRPK